MGIDWKKIGVVGLFAAAVVLFAFFIYFFFFRPITTPPAPAPTESENANGQLPETININGRIYRVNINGGLPAGENNANAEAEKITAEPETPQTAETSLITSQTALFATNGAESGLIYYNPDAGKFYRVSADGKISALSEKIFHNVSHATWSHNRERAVLEYPDGSNIIYDFQENKQITLPAHWQEFSFSPDDQQIAFKSVALDVENRFLAVSQYTGSNTRVLEPIGGKENQFQVNWSPNNQMVATFAEGRDANRSNVYFIGLNNENFKLMVVEGRDFRGLWSPTGDKMVYSVYDSQNDYQPELWVAQTGANSIGDNRRRLDLNTWGNKCTFFDNERVFCAVPQSLVFGAGLEPATANATADDIYEINLSTGAKRLVATPEGSHTISQIIKTNDPQYLFFTDKNSNRIYKVKL